MLGDVRVGSVVTAAGAPDASSRLVPVGALVVMVVVPCGPVVVDSSSEPSCWPGLGLPANRSNCFSSSSSLFSCGITSGFLSSMLEWLPMLRLSGSALPLSCSVFAV
uniref:Uncharacterized protein n=1 Tax=Anopheles culicifacies TaxID=139723 RepID=A0A182LU02_9DIPT